MNTYRAKRKEHRCDACGRRVPIGARYFIDKIDDYEIRLEHTNCLDYESEPLISKYALRGTDGKFPAASAAVEKPE